MKYLTTFIIVITLGSCAGPKVISFINDDVDLRDYETFRLIRFKGDENSDAKGILFFQELEKSILKNMDKRLFDETQKPDLIVSYEFVTSQRTENRSTNYYNPYYYYTPTYNYTVNYKEGVLLIEFRDRKQKKLVWQGSLDIDFTRGEPRELIAEAVDKIFLTYPYAAGSYHEIVTDPKKK